MKKVILSLLAILLMAGTATLAKAQDIVGPSTIQIYNWYVRLPLPGHPAYSSELAKLATEILQNGRPTNSAVIISNILRPEHLWQPQSGVLSNRTVALISRIVSNTNDLIANNLKSYASGPDPSGLLYAQTELTDPSLVFNSGFVGISRPAGSPAFPHVGHTVHTSGTTATTPVGEIIVSFPLRYLTDPFDNVEARLYLEPPGDPANYHFWGLVRYVTNNAIAAYSYKSLDSKVLPTNGLPRIVSSVSPTNPAVLYLDTFAEHDRSYVLEQNNGLGTNWTAVGTGNGGDRWVVGNSPTNGTQLFRLRQQ